MTTAKIQQQYITFSITINIHISVYHHSYTNNSYTIDINISVSCIYIYVSPSVYIRISLLYIAMHITKNLHTGVWKSPLISHQSVSYFITFSNVNPGLINPGWLIVVVPVDIIISVYHHSYTNNS